MRPNGPLEVSDVTKEGCTLKWKKPDDDGGSPIEYYEIEKMDTETGMWVPAGRSTEPKFDVKNLVPGKNYKFRVRAVNKEGDSDELQTEKSTLAKNPFGESLNQNFKIFVLLMFTLKCYVIFFSLQKCMIILVKSCIFVNLRECKVLQVSLRKNSINIH